MDSYVVDRIKRLEEDEATKLMRRYGVLCEDGTLTNAGRKLVWSYLLAEYKDQIVADLTRLAEEDDKPQTVVVEQTQAPVDTPPQA